MTVEHLPVQDRSLIPVGLPLGCDRCVLPAGYLGANFIEKDGEKICNFCDTHEARQFLGLTQLVRDLNLGDQEKVGVTVSGGKDSVWMWMTMVDLLGKDKVIAFNHHK